MRIIDEDGDLFGLVNLVDAGAVLLFVLLVTGVGVAVTSGGSGNPGELTQVVVVEATNVSAETVQTLSVGPVDNETVAGVLNYERISTRDGTSTVRLRVRLVVSIEGGTTTYGEERLYIGKRLAVDTSASTLVGVVVAADKPERFTGTVATPTPTPTPSPTESPTPTSTPTKEPSSTATATAQPGSTPENRVEGRTLVINGVVSNETATAITPGEVDVPGILSIENKEIRQVGPEEVELTLTVRVRVATTESRLFFRGVEIKSGTTVRLNFGGTVAQYTVVSVE